MKVYCPHTIGSTHLIHCNHGHIDGRRCPFWQQDGQYVHVENLMDNPVVMESALCKYIPEIIRDFEVVGNYRWYCTQWPGIREKGYVCMLQDSVGNKYTVEDVIKRYTNNNFADDEVSTEMIDFDGEGTTTGQFNDTSYY